MTTRILLAYDGSPAASRALEFALDMARRYDAALHVLAVFRPPEFGTEVETEEMIEQGRRHCSKLLQPLRSRFSRSGLQMTYEVAIGHPSEQILLYADRHGIDHIVVGHRGHSGLTARWLLGSVARQVMAHAQCVVTIVRG
jgi:nucleotide-binding universal stress UspA family protein